MPPWGSGLRRRLTARPGPLLSVALVVLALLAGRGLYGDGRLMGGALLPTPDSAGDVWRTYSQAWHPVGIGSATDSPPYLAVVVTARPPLLNHVSTAVDLLLLGAVPVAGVSAYIALRGSVVGPAARLGRRHLRAAAADGGGGRCRPACRPSSRSCCRCSLTRLARTGRRIGSARVAGDLACCSRSHDGLHAARLPGGRAARLVVLAVRRDGLAPLVATGVVSRPLVLPLRGCRPSDHPPPCSWRQACRVRASPCPT